MRLSDIIGKLLGSVTGLPPEDRSRPETRQTVFVPPKASLVDVYIAQIDEDGYYLGGAQSGADITIAPPYLQIQVLLSALQDTTSNSGNWNRHRSVTDLTQYLLGCSLPYTAGDLHSIFVSLTTQVDGRTCPLFYRDYINLLEPLMPATRAIVQSGNIDPSLHELLIKAITISENSPYFPLGSTNTLREILGKPSRIPLLAVDPWSAAALIDLQDIVEPERRRWVDILELAARISGAKPSNKWMATAVQKLDALGLEEYKLRIQRWLPLVSPSIQGEDQQIPMRCYTRDVLKGLIWLCAPLDDPSISKLIADTALKCFESAPGFGLVAPGAGNACILVLGEMTGIEPAAQLSRLKLRIKNRNVLKLFDKALETAADKAGLSTDEYEEVTVPTFGLDSSGKIRKEFGASAAEVTVRGANGAEVAWFGPDGTPRKAVPADVKRDYTDELAALKELTKAIGIQLSVQRRRVERLLMAIDPTPFENWRERYLHHPLIGSMCRSLIWTIESGGEASTAIWHNGQMVDSSGTVCSLFEAHNADSTVRLWHPIGLPADQVLRWRVWLETNRVSQSFKQAHREIYLITAKPSWKAATTATALQPTLSSSISSANFAVSVIGNIRCWAVGIKTILQPGSISQAEA